MYSQRNSVARQPYSAVVLIAVLGLLFTSPVRADLVYNPINPSFGGDAFNSSHLIGMAERQNQHKPSASSSSASGYSNSPADQFVRNLQSRMMSSLAGQVNDAIFGEDAAESGRIVFGDQEIEFWRGAEGVRMEIIDHSTGSTTEIVVPLLQVTGTAP